MRHRIWEALQRFWIADRGLAVFLGLLVIVVLVLPALGRAGALTGVAGNVAFSALLVAGALTLPERRWMRWGVPPIAALALLMRWAGEASGSADLTVWRELSTLMTLALFAVVVMGQVYRSGPVTHHRILGAVAVYLLLGLIWASAYEVLHHLRPGSFAGGLDAASASQTWIYYSFVTLTTMGYGDITPAHPVARSLAIAEALIGQLYLAITLARLVALHVGARSKD
jgi:hypothetical protein